MTDFTDYYFYHNKTEIANSVWKRLFEGGAKSKGFFYHLKQVHLNPGSIRYRSLLNTLT